MSPRLDGMPEGHPEKQPAKQPAKLATLTLYASGDHAGDDVMAWGELTIAGPVPADQVEHVQSTVRAMLREVLESDPTVVGTDCACGRCGTTGGDAS